MSDKSPFFDPGPASADSAPTMVPGRAAARPAPPPSAAPGGETEGSMRTMRGRTAPRGERLRAGDVLLGRYTVLSELGEGGMGVVYRCLDSVGGIEVALKCLPPELSRNEAEMEGVRENYAIVARLRHSAISGLRQLEKDPAFGEYYLVMDLAEGEDLSAILRRRHGAPMPSAEALDILRPLASALDYAHGEKVLHRDVKPGNVKVATAGGASRPGEPSLVTRHSSPVPSKLRVQLLDFGLAAEVRSSMSRVSLRGHAGSSGTPAYMAPEQWEARPQSAATDQYALAVMAYQMLSGSLPFDADDTDLLRRAVLSRAPDPVPGLPRAANAALLRALAKDPAARFPSCTAFVEALRLAGTARPTRSRFALAAAALVAVAAGIFLTQSHRDTEVVSHAESAESAETISHAESAEAAESANPETRNPNPAAKSEFRNPNPAAGEGALSERAASDLPASGGASRPGEPQRGGGLQTAEGRQEAARSENAPSLPPEGSSLADLEDARALLESKRDALAGEGYAATDPERAPVEKALATLKSRIDAAEAEQARKTREAEIAGRRAAAQRAVDLQALSDLKRAVERRVDGLDATWTDGEFAKRRKAIADARKAIDACTDADSLPKAKELRGDIYDAADWIERNAPARAGLEETARALDVLAADCTAAGADRFAAASLRKAARARKDAEKERDSGRFEDAATGLAESKTLYEKALAEARAAQSAAEVESAKTYRDGKLWEQCLAAARKALEWEPGNADAAALKAEAEKNLRPVWAVSATLPGGAAATGATLALGGKSYALPISLNLSDGSSYGPGEVTLEKNGKTYVGTLAKATVDWKGTKSAAVALQERKEEEGRARSPSAPQSAPAARSENAPSRTATIDLGGGVSLEMVHCPGVAQDFWMGKYEVTQEQWQRVMGSNPSHFKNHPKFPVETVSWNDCKKFVEKLNALPAARSSGLTFRLPTEQEWETCCRAGAPLSADYCRLTDGTQITASTLSRVARYGKGWDEGPANVGSRLPNAWGLYNMHGNVWEWTETADGDCRVRRGGSFCDTADDCGAGFRYGYWPGDSGRSLGLRLAASGSTVSGLPAEAERKDHGAVQLWEGGPYWAETNVGAEKPEEYGLYFWWGDTVGYRREGDAWVASDGSNRNFKFDTGNTPKNDKDSANPRREMFRPLVRRTRRRDGKEDGILQREVETTPSGVLAPEHDAAHVHWGGSWRMPTKKEMSDLCSKCDWTWTTLNDVEGYVVRGRGAYAGAQIFLPVPGFGFGNSLNHAGLHGHYWSSVPESDSNLHTSCGLYFDSVAHHTLGFSRSFGQSVRPVQGFAE